MKILLMVIFLVILVFLWIVYPIQRAIKKSSVLQINSKVYEQHPDSPTMKILVMGDSTAVGIGASESNFSTAGRLGEKYQTADITNISRYGMRLSELLGIIRGLPQSLRYDLILLQIGANDVTHFTPLSEVTTLLNAILDEAQSRSSKVIILSSGNIGLSPVFRFPFSSLLSKRTRDVREVYIAETKDRTSVSYIDLYKERSSDIFISDVKKYYAEDRFHPSSDGYLVWFTELEKVLLQ